MEDGRLYVVRYNIYYYSAVPKVVESGRITINNEYCTRTASGQYSFYKKCLFGQGLNLCEGWALQVVAQDEVQDGRVIGRMQQTDGSSSGADKCDGTLQTVAFPKSLGILLTT